MLIEVTATTPPRVGGKVAHIKTADGARFEIQPDKLDGIQVGKAYEVETRERDWQGRTIRSITTIAPATVNGTAVNGAPAAIASTQASPHPGEAEYVGRVLAALIAKGEVDKDKIAAATGWLRKLWRQTP